MIKTPESVVRPPATVRIAALGDLHFGRGSPSLRPLLDQIVASADILALCGDLTDTGLPEEAAQLAKEFAGVKIPMVAVLGNHDYESGRVAELRPILSDAGVWVLDGDVHEVDGVGFAGVKGFAGGFGRGTLGPWGEEMIKRFVHEAIDEALKLESALGRLRSSIRIALLHYSPIVGTVEGEPLEIYPWLGSSRLEEPLSRYPVNAVLHGHARHGRPEGRTMSGVPVYNVSLTLLRHLYPDRPPFRILEIPTAPPPPPQAPEPPPEAMHRRATDRPSTARGDSFPAGHS